MFGLTFSSPIDHTVILKYNALLIELFIKKNACRNLIAAFSQSQLFLTKRFLLAK